MEHRRRKYDVEDHGTMINWAHDRLDKLEPKLDKLNRNYIWATGFIAALIFMMNYPQLLKTLEPSSAIAETVK